MRWRCSHPLFTIFFEEEDGILQRVELSPPDPTHPSDNHPFCEVFIDYLNGKEIIWPPYNQNLLTPFQKSVFSHVISIPRGEVRTYGEIARLIENPKATRAVARALSRNPFPLVIPCHRVVSHAFPKELGGYTPNPSFKRLLLKNEGFSL